MFGTHTRRVQVYAVNSLYNRNKETLDKVQRLSNRNLAFAQSDIRDSAALSSVFAEFKPDAVIHFAGLKAVGESSLKPVIYYDVNVGGTALLLDVMEQNGCDNTIFSSSATVYGEPLYLPCDENHPLNPINSYGRTKLMGENLIKDWSLDKTN